MGAGKYWKCIRVACDTPFVIQIRSHPLVANSPCPCPCNTSAAVVVNEETWTFCRQYTIDWTSFWERCVVASQVRWRNRVSCLRHPPGNSHPLWSGVAPSFSSQSLLTVLSSQAISTPRSRNSAPSTSSQTPKIFCSSMPSSPSETPNFPRSRCRWPT